MPMVITATAPSWLPTKSLAKPIAKGKIVPPNKPIIIRPEISFFFSGMLLSACAKIIEKTLELPNSMSVMQTYIANGVFNTNKP